MIGLNGLLWAGGAPGAEIRYYAALVLRLRQHQRRSLRNMIGLNRLLWAGGAPGAEIRYYAALVLRLRPQRIPVRSLRRLDPRHRRISRRPLPIGCSTVTDRRRAHHGKQNHQPDRQPSRYSPKATYHRILTLDPQYPLTTATDGAVSMNAYFMSPSVLGNAATENVTATSRRLAAAEHSFP